MASGARLLLERFQCCGSALKGSAVRQAQVGRAVGGDAPERRKTMTGEEKEKKMIDQHEKEGE